MTNLTKSESKWSWIDRTISFNHITITQSKKRDPWYYQIQAQPADDTKEYHDVFTPVSGVLIYNKALHGDMNSIYVALNIRQDETLKFKDNVYDLDNNYVCIKFYKIMPPKNNEESTTNRRLIYAVSDPDDIKHEQEYYKHPEMIQVDEETGEFTIPAGLYGCKGWEIIVISKEITGSRTFYRLNDDPYLPIDPIPNSLSIINTDKINVIKEIDKTMAQYAIPYFNIQNHPIVGVGYNGPALYETNNFKTDNEVEPFNSKQPRYWNFSTEEHEIIYDGEINMNDPGNVWVEIQNDDNKKIVVVNVNNETTKYNLQAEDEVLLYIRKPGTYKVNEPVETNIEAIDTSSNNFSSNLSTGFNQLQKNSITDKYFYEANTPLDQRVWYYVSGVRGNLTSKGQINFKPLDIIKLKDIDDYAQFTTTTYPHNKDNQPLTPIDNANLYEYYSHIIVNKKYTTTIKTNKSPIGLQEQQWEIHTQNSIIDTYCALVDNSSNAKWTGIYTSIIEANIPTLNLFNNQGIGTENQDSINGFVRPNSGSHTLLNFIKIGGEVTKTGTTVGLIDNNSYGILGLTPREEGWQPSLVSWYASANDTSSIQNINSYYISESDPDVTFDSIWKGDTEHNILKSWIGWSTRNIPTSYAIWVVIWRWSKTE